MSDLSDFLLARIAEDEAAALAVEHRRWTVERHQDPGDDQGWVVLSGEEWIAQPSDEFDEATARHIARQDPARILAETATKRRWVEWVERESPSDLADDQRHSLRFMATTYADHPDFDPRWRV